MILRRLFIQELSKALTKPTPDNIPRAGEEGKQVNCYRVYVTDNDGTYLADEVVDNGKHLNVTVWNEEKRTHEGCKQLDLHDLKQMNFTIHHFHGLVTFTYNSPLDFLVHELPRIYQLQSKIVHWKFAIPQLLNFSKQYTRPDRSKVLSAVIELSETNHTQTLDVTRILNHIYGMYAMLHPQYPSLKQATLLVMKSLAESEDIEMVNQSECRIRGNALTTMENLQLDATERKRSQITMWLTIIFAITSLFQSKLVVTDLSLNLDSIITTLWLGGKTIVNWMLS